MVRGRYRTVHDLCRSDQFDIRHHDLPPVVVRVQSEFRSSSDSVSIGLGRRGLAVADADRSHDPHAKDTVHTEPGRMAGHADNRRHNGRWYLHPVHASGDHPQDAIASAQLLPMVGRNAGFILPADADYQGLVCPEVQPVAVMHERKIKTALLAAFLLAGHPLMAQQTDAAGNAERDSPPERLNIYYQATS